MTPPFHPNPNSKVATMEYHIHQLLILLGEDPCRQGLKETPSRVAQLLQQWTCGLQHTASDAISSLAIFDAPPHPGAVCQKNMAFHSLCEHHLLPFYGHIHIAYWPKSHLVGFRELKKLTDIYARRLQIQERLTQQIADGLFQTIKPQAALTIIEASHLCMSMEGSCHPQTTAITPHFMGNHNLKTELMRLLGF